MKQTFVIGILLKGDKLLLKERRFWRDVSFVKKIESRYETEVFFPKGIIHDGENVHDALARSVKSDYGVTISNPSFLGEFFFKDAGNAQVFLIRSWYGDLKQLRGQGKFIWAKNSTKLTNEFDRNLFNQIQSQSKF